MEKSNQLPKTEGCLAEGEPVEPYFHRAERPSRSVRRSEPQAGVASRTPPGSSTRYVMSCACITTRSIRMERRFDGQDFIAHFSADGEHVRASFPDHDLG